MEKFICRKIRQLLLMLMALILCLASVPAAAVDGAARPTEGLCIHHPAHDAACGYQEGTPAQPCNHVHDAACGYREPIGEVPCDQGCADANGDGQIDHAAGCAYRPAQEAQPRNHVHDAACGYRAAGTASPCAYAQAGCPYCVRAWDWVDPLGALTQAEQGWVLALPGVGPEQPLTRDAAASLLPAQINATLQNGQPASLDLSWDLSAIPEAGAAAGEYPVLASLADPTYALPQEDALSIILQAGGAQTYALEMPYGEPPYADHIVQGISPLGTTIHLFDYWIEGQTAADNEVNHSTPFLSKGINNGHALLFGNGMGQNTNKIGEWNKWTGNEEPYKGIVKSNLGDDGYPQLNLTIPSDTALTTTDGNQSLAYLFNPKMQADGKASYPNVKGLLQVDENGYYYYDSGENYAVYYQDVNSFVLYDHPGVKNGGASTEVGNFFPFNAVTEAPDTSDGVLMSTVSSTDSSINHYFGVHMSTRFIQLNGGLTAGKRVTYEFSGDDDVWVFIDGVLVADLGGIHDSASVKIDFSTGKITINGTEQGQTLGELLGENEETLADNTQHTLDFFYLERGNVDSNMVLKYNLVTQPESSLIKIDQLGDPVAGAEFNLYAYAANAPGTAISTGTTDGAGRFIFMNPEDSTPLTIQELYEKYGKSEDGADNKLIVEEIHTPAGYRTIDQVELSFFVSKQKEVLLLSNSIWDKGAYAMPKVTVTAPGSIALLGTKGEEAISLENDPLMFAVVYQKQGENDWRPVYGDPIHGWHVEADSNWDSVLSAAKANPYVFQLTSNGSYQVTIENLPGDIKTYYHICGDADEAQYTVAYYYTKAENLDEATKENTWRIDSQNINHPLERIFSMDLYITNIKNRLLVQKVDQAGKPLAGAEFTLYKAGDANVENGAVTIKADAAAYDTLQTEGAGGSLGLEGGGLFPTPGNVLEKGEYYLVETSAPDGYKPNPAAVHIIVDDTGVYADAGQPEDGISVLRGVGSVIKSMVQFAAEDDVDATLQDIKAALATSVTLDETSRQFTVSDKGIDWGSEGQDILHLQYDNANKLLDYGLYDAPATVTLDDVTLETKAGWSKLLIRQCYQHDSGTGSSLKTDLGEQDITDLFSGTVTVRVVNDRAEGLTIAKTVTGNTAPAGESYQIEIVVHNGKPISGSYDTVSGAGESDSITFIGGKATASLQAGESLTIFGLPNGASYTVTETQTQEQAYTTTVSVNGAGKQGHEAAGTLTADGQTVRFINAYPTKPGGHDPGHEDEPKPTPPIPGSLERPPATGDGGGQALPWALLAASLAALALAWKRCPQTRSRG